MHCNTGSFGEGKIVNTSISLFKEINFIKEPGPRTEPTVCSAQPQLSFHSVPWGSYCCYHYLLLQLWLMSSRVWTCTQLFGLQSVTPCQTQTKHHAECLRHWVLYLFILASFVSIYLLSLTEALKKNEQLGPAYSSAPPLTVSSFASLWCSANAYFIYDDADQEVKPQFLRLLETIVLI